VTLGASDTNVILFQTPKGQASKKLPDTNMDLAGQLPAGQKFTVKAITMRAEPGITLALLKALMTSGSFEFKIGEKSYLKLPVAKLTAGCGIDGVTTGTTMEAYHNGQGDPRAIYSLELPIDIDPGQNFAVEMNWNTAPGAVKFWVDLEGTLKRAVQ
jgi:hypothetical protein